MSDEVVVKLYRALVEELRRRDHPADQPVKVSALYRDLVPYRAVRSTLGVDLNADYEHALLRLLAGERGLLRLDPADAREELRQEVEAAYPFVGLFRKFGTSKVWVTMPEEGDDDDVVGTDEPATAEAAEAAEAGEGSGPRLHEPERTEPRSGSERASGAAASGGAAPGSAPVRLHAESLPDRDRRTGPGGACVFCNEPLPEGRRLRFCPHCGGDQRLRPCPRCDAVLERDWQYCISCGYEVTDG